jgi:5-formyltetrahydrofolate cyclo-ligase
MPAEDNKEKRRRMVEEVRDTISSLSPEELGKKKENVNSRIFEFANYAESKIAMLYFPLDDLEFDIDYLFSESVKRGKVITFPYFGEKKDDIRFFKIDNLKQDLVKSDSGIMVPDIEKCREIPNDYIDIAVIPGMAFDEKGGRIASDNGEYDRLITKLPITTRKIALGFEEQIVSQIPMESKKKYVDMIITDERVIYKI